MIYFMQPVGGGAVKIGYTENVDARRKSLESRYGQRLAILSVLSGGPAAERSIHERFARLRFGKTEQFRPSEELMAFIGRGAQAAPSGEASPMIPCCRDLLFKVPRDLHERIQKAADQEGNSVAAFIRSAVVKELKRRERDDAE